MLIDRIAAGVAENECLTALASTSARPNRQKKIHKEGVRLKREEMLSVHDARAAFAAIVPHETRLLTNFRSEVTAYRHLHRKSRIIVE